jgi:hypothetical protein
LNRRPSSGSAELRAVRQSLVGLVQRFELDDATMGIVGIVPVVGGVFIHPLTREPIQSLRVYGAAADLVKIVEPLFLRSLPLLSIAGLTNPTQFCALVVGLLNERLRELARIREQVAAVGARLELEHDILRLRGCFNLQRLEVELLASSAGTVTVTALSGHSVTGSIARNDRSLALIGDPTIDRDALVRLVGAIEERLYAALTPTGDAATAVKPLGADIEPALSIGALSREGTVPALGPFSSGVGTAEIVELVEALEPTTRHEAERYPSIPLRELFDKLGTEVQISAAGNALHLQGNLRVIQGLYTFSVQQQGPKRFVGFIASQNGQRYPIEFDLNGIMDIKEVFDRVVLGKTVS